MSPEVDRTRYQLSEERNERVFRSDIVPTELAGTPQRHPVVVFVAGQTGAGKTSVTHLIETSIGQRGRPVNIDLDTYKPYHPRYDELIANDDTTAGAYTSIDGHKWMEKAEAYAIEQRYDVVMESAMRDPRDFEEPAHRFKQAGYRVEVVIVAVHESLSRLGALDRYLQQSLDDGRGRIVDPAIHDACYRGVLRSADAIDTEHLADWVIITRRDAHVVHTNHLEPDGGWAYYPAGTRAAVETERNRPWTDAEQNRYLNNLQRLQKLAEHLPEAAQRLARPEAAIVAELAGPLVDPDTRARAASLTAGMPVPEADDAIGLLRMSHPNPPAITRGTEQQPPDRPAPQRDAGLDRSGEDHGL